MLGDFKTSWEVLCLETPVPGSIQYAQCSQEADAHSIRREIGDQVRHVDHAIHVLLTAGMSTPALRSIAHSVNIKHVAFAEITGAVLLLSPGTFADLIVQILIWAFDWDEDRTSSVPYKVNVLWGLLARLILLVALCRSPWDEQRFILKVMSRFLVVAVIYVFCTLFISFMHESAGAFLDFWLLFLVAFAFLGIRGTAQLPLGLHALHIFFSRGSNTWNALKAPGLWIQHFWLPRFHLIL